MSKIKNNNMKTFNCMVRDNWMGSLETADITVESPTGKSLTLKKVRYWNKKSDISPEATSIISLIRGKVSEYIRNTDKIKLRYPIPLTKEEMEKFKNLTDLI